MEIEELETALSNKSNRELTTINPGKAFNSIMNQYGHPVLISTFRSGFTGYRIWSDGFCEQWGLKDYGSYQNGSWASNASGGFWSMGTVSFLKTFKDTTYNLIIGQKEADLADHFSASWLNACHLTTTNFTINVNCYVSGQHDLVRYAYWLARGYLASGQY